MLGLLSIALLAVQVAPAPALSNSHEFVARPATPPMRSDPKVDAELRQLEKRWGESFLSRDWPFLEAVIAPEFRLVSTGTNGVTSITSRADWMRNTKAFQHLGFTGEVLDITSAGNTAVVLLRTSWSVKRFADRPASTTYGIITDTWVRRGGKWQVVNRYSQRLPAPTASPAATSSR